MKYLGVDLVAGKQLSFSITKPLLKFRFSVNTIIAAQNAPPDEVLLKLMYTCYLRAESHLCRRGT